MRIGTFGDVAFSVSTTEIKTIRSLTQQGGASIQSHKRHLNVDLPEFTGTELETVSFSVRLSKYLGVSNPTTDLNKLIGYARNGTPKYFVLGNRTFGRYKWLLSKYKVTHEYYDKYGNSVSMDVAITLTEYPKR